jgi:hypothetical protein
MHQRRRARGRRGQAAAWWGCGRRRPGAGQGLLRRARAGLRRGPGGGRYGRRRRRRGGERSAGSAGQAPQRGRQAQRRRHRRVARRCRGLARRCARLCWRGPGRARSPGAARRWRATRDAFVAAVGVVGVVVRAAQSHGPGGRLAIEHEHNLHSARATALHLTRPCIARNTITLRGSTLHTQTCRVQALEPTCTPALGSSSARSPGVDGTAVSCVVGVEP